MYTAAQGGYTIPSQIYHDVYLSYTYGEVPSGGRLRYELLANLKLQVGVRNIFNTRPPFDANYGPYFYSTYGDPRLRDYRIGISKSF